MTHVTDEEFNSLSALTPMSLFSDLYAYYAYMDKDEEPSPDHMVRSYYAQMHKICIE